MKKLWIFSESYPTNMEPEFPFVQQLAHGLTKRGIKVCVIAPQSISKSIIRRRKLRPLKWDDFVESDAHVSIYQPVMVSFSNSFNSILQRITYKTYELALRYILKTKVKKQDAVYAYFWHMGLTAAKVLEHMNVPLYIQASESEITVGDWMKDYTITDRVQGVICASGKNKKESIIEKLTTEEKTIIIPNGFNSTLFYKEDKMKLRKQMGIAVDAFIVVFVGGFIERKGTLRVSQAISNINEDIGSIFIGKGTEEPDCSGIIFKGVLPHNEIVHYLNCADVFVLPTLAEGCCNAIIEAMACGLPIISSNRSFNDELLDDTCSIKVNPDSVVEIQNAILTLKHNPKLRKQMSENAHKKAAGFTIERRAEAIEQYIFNNS